MRDDAFKPLALPFVFMLSRDQNPKLAIARNAGRQVRPRELVVSRFGWFNEGLAEEPRGFR